MGSNVQQTFRRDRLVTRLDAQGWTVTVSVPLHENAAQ